MASPLVAANVFECSLPIAFDTARKQFLEQRLRFVEVVGIEIDVGER